MNRLFFLSFILSNLAFFAFLNRAAFAAAGDINLRHEQDPDQMEVDDDVPVQLLSVA